MLNLSFEICTLNFNFEFASDTVDCLSLNFELQFAV